MQVGPDMWTALWKEAEAKGILTASRATELVRSAELASLPQAVRRYMRFFGVEAGTPKTRSFALAWDGRFRLGPEKPWMPVHAVQVDTAYPLARIFHMRAKMGGFLPVLARDTYTSGHGHMLAKILGIVRVADGRGPEFDQGELVTWLNDAVLFAPTMLLRRNVHFHDMGPSTFDVELDDAGCIVRARVFLDEEGAPKDFETTDRFLEDPYEHRLVRGKWRTPIDVWLRLNGHPIFAHGKALWRLKKGDFVYAELDPIASSLVFDVEPREPSHVDWQMPAHPV